MFDHIRRAAILFLLLACGWLALPAVAADAAPDIRTLMTPEEFHAAGLGKLGPAEIEALNKWLLHYTVKDAPTQRKVNPVVKEEMKKMDDTVIRTRIAGAFTGWSGKTLFRLENGQVWKQRMDGKWYKRAESPEVELKKNMLGLWMLRVIDGDKAIGVTRIE
jgi:hypothetical protein